MLSWFPSVSFLLFVRFLPLYVFSSPLPSLSLYLPLPLSLPPPSMNSPSLSFYKFNPLAPSPLPLMPPPPSNASLPLPLLPPGRPYPLPHVSERVRGIVGLNARVPPKVRNKCASSGSLERVSSFRLTSPRPPPFTNTRTLTCKASLARLKPYLLTRTCLNFVPLSPTLTNLVQFDLHFPFAFAHTP